MKRDLFLWELKKLWSVPMFGIFLVLCMGFNTMLVVDDWYGYEYVSYVSEVAECIGGQMGRGFDRQLAQMPEHEYKQKLISETAGAEDIYENYDTNEILSIIKEMYRLNDREEDLLTLKYEGLQETVTILEKEDAALSLAAAGMTHDLLGSLFQMLCRAIITEGWLLAVLMALYLSCSEGLTRTKHLVYSSKAGRGVQKSKYAASACSAILVYLILAGSGIVLFSLLWDMDTVWGASMSGQFHYRVVGVYRIPFLTWKPFTVKEYLVAMLALGAVVVMIFHAIGFCIGMVIGDVYKGFLTLFSAGLLNFLAYVLAANGKCFGIYQLMQWNPVVLWWKQYKWFTDMDLESLFPWQECLEAVFCGMMAAVIGMICRRWFCRKDI